MYGHDPFLRQFIEAKTFTVKTVFYSMPVVMTHSICLKNFGNLVKSQTRFAIFLNKLYVFWGENLVCLNESQPNH